MSDSDQSVLQRSGQSAKKSAGLLAEIEGILSSAVLVQAGLLVMALLGVLVLYVSTIRGAGVGGDATIYITSARNLIAGKGLGLILPDGSFRLLPYFPPFFSLVLALPGLLGLDLAEAARWLNLLLFGAAIWLVGGVTFNATRSGAFALLAGLLVLVSPVLIPVYSWAMSEPLAIFLSLAGLALLLPYLRGPARRDLLIASAMLLGLGILTRYAHAAFLLAGALGILALSRSAFVKRLKDALLYGVIGVVPAVLWVLYDLGQTATVSSRSVESAAGMSQRIANLWPSLRGVFLFWFIPDSWIEQPPYPSIANLALLAGALALLVILMAVAVVLNRGRSSEERAPGVNLAWLLAFSLAAYLLVIAAVYITTYPPITIAGRMLSPAHLVFLWLLALLCGMIAARLGRARWIAALLALGFVAFAGWYGWRSARIVQQNYELGLGFNAVEWQQSDTIEAVKALPDSALLVTNEEMALLYLTGRASYPLAEIYYDRPLEQFSVYGQGDGAGDTAQALFREGKAGLVLFVTLDQQLESLYGGRAAERAAALVEGLDEVFRGEDGSIYANPSPAP